MNTSLDTGSDLIGTMTTGHRINVLSTRPFCISHQPVAFTGGKAVWITLVKVEYPWDSYKTEEIEHSKLLSLIGNQDAKKQATSAKGGAL